MAKENRFSALRQLRDQRQEEESQDSVEAAQTTPAQEVTNKRTKEPPTTERSSQSAADVTPKAKSVSRTQPTKPASKSKKRGPGRPPGRRSNPDYTQISAYIPLELLLEVQDELAEERREKMQRTPRPVSDLMEELLANWLKKRKRKNPGI